MHMKPAALARFELFAEAFARKYWETVKSGAFSMPPDEPVEESVDELLSGVSRQMELMPSAGDGGPECVLRMINSHGDWWVFTFRGTRRAWEIVGASAGSSDHTSHDLFGPVYAQYYAPMLRHVSMAANNHAGI
jgi:hypothetical protein